MQGTSTTNQAETIDRAHDAWRSARDLAERAVWPDVEAAQTAADEAFDAWLTLERS